MSWDKFYLNLAKEISQKSKDPSTKVGAVIVRHDNTPVSFGFNGFPKRMDDSESRYLDREFKYRWVQHAERNALSFAREPLNGCKIYLTHPPCSQCLGAMAQAGIFEVYHSWVDYEFKERWNYYELCEISRELGISIWEVKDEQTA